MLYVTYLCRRVSKYITTKCHIPNTVNKRADNALLPISTNETKNRKCFVM